MMKRLLLGRLVRSIRCAWSHRIVWPSLILLLGLFDAQSRLLVNYLGAPREEAPGIWTEASPVEWVSEDDPPAYLYHGKSDGLVDIQHARLLASRLRESDVDVILDEVPGGHVTVFLTGRDIEARATAFLTRLLSG